MLSRLAEQRSIIVAQMYLPFFINLESVNTKDVFYTILCHYIVLPPSGVFLGL
jgi:hypothetical protein